MRRALKRLRRRSRDVRAELRGNAGGATKTWVGLDEVAALVAQIDELIEESTK